MYLMGKSVNHGKSIMFIIVMGHGFQFAVKKPEGINGINSASVFPVQDHIRWSTSF
jgi:hypothetical protein